MTDLELILALVTAPLYYPVILLFTPRKQLHKLIHTEENISYLQALQLLEVAEDWHQRSMPILRQRLEAIGREILFTPRTEAQKQHQIKEVLHAAMYANFPTRWYVFSQATFVQQVVFVIGLIMGPVSMTVMVMVLISNSGNELSYISDHLANRDYISFGIDVITIVFMIVVVGYMMSLIFLSIYHFYITILCLSSAFIPGNKQALFVFQDIWEQMIIMVFPFKQFNRINQT